MANVSSSAPNLGANFLTGSSLFRSLTLTTMVARRLFALLAAAWIVLGCVTLTKSPRGSGAPSGPSTLLPTMAPAPATLNADDPIHQIEHVVIIQQENRSFDSYFGTYPGVDGLPSSNGVRGACLLAAQNDNRCVASFHDSTDAEVGGPHGYADANADIN